MIGYYTVTFVGSLAVCLLLTPMVRSMAHRRGFVDKPDGRRKMHVDATALGGGVAIMIAMIVTSIAALAAAVGLEILSLADLPFFVGLLVAVVFLAGIGLIDDSVGMRGRYKLAGQIAACLVLVASGLNINEITVFRLVIDLGPLAIPFTIFWLLGTINAINLLDGIDGLASSIGMLLSLTVAVLAALTGEVGCCLVALALAGALAGFLRYNFQPASIYLGDTGSMIIGLVIGAITINSTIKGSASLAFAVPVCLMAIPILDSCAALLRRKLTGRSLFATDRGHFHHLLLHRGCSVRQAVLVISAICLVTCIGAVLSVYIRKDYIAIATVVFVVTGLISCRVFGHVEFGLFLNRVVSAVRRRVFRHGKTSNEPVHNSYHLHGSRNWDNIWTALTESVESYGLSQMELTISMPAIHESFHAVWTQSNGHNKEQEWRIETPLLVDGQLAGNLVMCGQSGESGVMRIGEIADFLEPVESQIKYVASNPVRHRKSSPVTNVKQPVVLNGSATPVRPIQLPPRLNGDNGTKQLEPTPQAELN